MDENEVRIIGTSRGLVIIGHGDSMIQCLRDPRIIQSGLKDNAWEFMFIKPLGNPKEIWIAEVATEYNYDVVDPVVLNAYRKEISGIIMPTSGIVGV